MKVYLKLFHNHHPYYFTFINNPPEGVEYLYEKRETVYPLPPRKSSMLSDFKYKVVIPIYKQFPPLYYVRAPKSAKLIHATSNVLLLNNKPWVVDTEAVNGFVNFNIPSYNSSLHHRIIRRILERDSCRRVLPWSKAASDSVFNLLKSGKVHKKSTVVYPTVPVAKKAAQKPGSKFRFLFIGGRFFRKGGRETLEAFSKLKRKLDCSLTFISNTPDEYVQKYKGMVSFMPPKLTPLQIMDLMAEHHALVFPTYMDTYGMVLLEAMSTGLPVISSKLFCIPEIVEKDTGVLLEPPVKWHTENMIFDYRKFPTYEAFVNYIQKHRFEKFSEELSESMYRLADDSDAWKSYSTTAKEKINSGKFSIKQRNKRLGEIYAESVGEG